MRKREVIISHRDFNDPHFATIILDGTAADLIITAMSDEQIKEKCRVGLSHKDAQDLRVISGTCQELIEQITSELESHPLSFRFWRHRLHVELDHHPDPQEALEAVTRVIFARLGPYYTVISQDATGARQPVIQADN